MCPDTLYKVTVIYHPEQHDSQLQISFGVWISSNDNKVEEIVEGLVDVMKKKDFKAEDIKTVKDIENTGITTLV